MKPKYLFLALAAMWLIAIVLFTQVALPRLGGLSQLTRIAFTGSDTVFAAKSFDGNPIPSGPDALTYKGLQKFRLQYYQKLIPEAYKRFGMKHPEKSAEEAALLDGLAKYFADLPETPDLTRLAQPLLKSNPKDPMVLFAIGVSFMDKDRNTEAESYIQQAIKLFPNSKYSKTLYWRAPLRLVQIYTGNAEKQAELDNALRQALEWMGEGADYPFAEYEQRFFWETISICLPDETPAERRAQFVKALSSNPKADPWLQHVTAGYHEVELAWEARSSGWASEVTEEGWEGFFNHLKEARKHLTAAWELHPNYPEAPAHMISVAMGERNSPEPEREWFDRAVAGQMDYMPAYNLMHSPLMPRWGGSHEAMYKFGLECLGTKRFDTGVPMQLYELIHVIESCDGDDSYWQRPDVNASLQKLLRGLIAEPSQKDQITHYRTLLFIMLMRVNQYDDARKVLDETNGSLNDGTVWNNTWTHPEWLKGEVCVRTGPAKEQFTQAEIALGKGEYAKAVLTLEGLLAKKIEPKAEQYLQHRITSARLDRDLHKGGWVTLPIETNLPGWRNYGGCWEIAGDGAVILADVEYPPLLLLNEMGDDFEVTGEVEFLGGDPSLAAEIVIDYKKSTQECHTVLIHHNGVIGVLPNDEDNATAKKVDAPKDRYHFLVQVKNGRATASIDGKEIVSEWIKEEIPPSNTPGCLGLSVSPSDSGGGNRIVKFSNLKVKR